MSGKCLKNSVQPLENVQQLLFELTLKRINLSTWIQKALLYYGRCEYESFVQLLEVGIVKSGKSYDGYKNDLARSYTLLAGHFIRLVYRETGNRRLALQAKVTNLLKAADELEANDSRHLVVRGYALMLSAARTQDADNSFLSVLRQMSYNVPSLVGRGCLAYNRQEYIAALGYFKSVLMRFPRGPGDVRVGVGHCFLKLNNVDNARRAFELALEYNGRCQNALVGMALLKLNLQEKHAQQEGMNLMCAAFEQFNRHPAVLSSLAVHHYYVGKYEEARTLAANAIKHTDSRELRAQNYFQIARTYHAKQEFETAFDFYEMAVKVCPDHYGPAYLGLAQMYLRRSHVDEAIACLQTLLKIMPDQLEGLRLLSILYMRDSTGSKIDVALEMILKVMKLDPSMKKDFDIWLNLAKGYEHKELWPECINSYEQALQIHELKGKKIPLELLNNLALAQLYDKRINTALVTIERALLLSSSRTYAADESTKCNRLTLRFNRARILEELYMDEVAESLYKELVDECPTYVDCYIRLGQMAAKRNQSVLAMDYFKDVLKVDNNNITVRSLMGNYYMREGMTTHAMYCYNVILRCPETRRDPYTMVAVGNVCLANVQRALANEDKATAKRHQEKAINLFRKALEEDPRNLWAANGIGAALCSGGLFTEAAAIFKQILESRKSCTQALINSANVSLELKQYKQASQSYQICLEEFLPPNSVEVMQLLARSLYQGGRAKDAKLMLLKVRHILPRDHVLLYNLGLAIKQYCIEVFQMQRCELADLELAEQELNVALSYFKYLMESTLETKVSKHNAEKQADKCRVLLANLPEKLSRVQAQEQMEVERRHLQEQRYQELQKQLQKQRLLRQEQENMIRENQKAKRLEVIQRTKNILVSDRENKPPQKRRTKKTKRADNDNDNEGNENRDKSVQSKSKRSRKSSYKSKALILEAESDDSSTKHSDTEKIQEENSIEPKEGPLQESENLVDRLKSISQRRQVEMDNFMAARESGKLDETEVETPEMITEYMERLKKKMQSNAK